MPTDHEFDAGRARLEQGVREAVRKLLTFTRVADFAIKTDDAPEEETLIVVGTKESIRKLLK